MVNVIIATHMLVCFYLCCQKRYQTEDKKVTVPSTSQENDFACNIAAAVLQSLESSGRLLPAKKSMQPGVPTSSKNVMDNDSTSNDDSDSDTMVESDDGTGMSYDCVLPSKLKRKIVKLVYVNKAEMLSPNEKEASSFQF